MTKFGDDLIEAMSEVLAYQRGEDIGAIVHHIDVGQIDPRNIRNRLKLTQEQMALLLGTSVSGYRKWEQGTRQPRGAARTLLRVMEKEPEAVVRALTD